jgi:predicted DNA-binding ribbon-helix-helix protein
MCRLFKTQDPATYASETRPMRLHGHCTSVRLEAAYWDTLEEIAGHEGVSVARFCATLHDEMQQQGGEVSNFASMLRVTCLHYLRNQDAYFTQIAARGHSLEKIAVM